MKPTTICLTAFLGLSGCAGDFCEVWQGPKLFAPETAKLMVQTDRSTVVKMRTEDDYGRKYCIAGQAE